MRGAFLVGVALLGLVRSTVAADLSSVLAMKAPPAPVPVAYDWSGFYLGSHLGYAWGNSNWTTPGISGSFDLFQPFDAFAETGSYFGGLQVGYDTMLANFRRGTDLQRAGRG
jgi:opacity protein-like surface antigen